MIYKSGDKTGDFIIASSGELNCKVNIMSTAS